MKDLTKVKNRPVNRRTLLKGGLLASGAATLGVGLFGKGATAYGEESSSSLNKGDIAILRLLAAAERSLRASPSAAVGGRQ